MSGIFGGGGGEQERIVMYTFILSTSSMICGTGSSYMWLDIFEATSG